MPLGVTAAMASEARPTAVSNVINVTSLAIAESETSYEGVRMTIGTLAVTAWESTITTDGATYTQADIGSSTLTQSGAPIVYGTDVLSMATGGVVVDRSTQLDFSTISTVPTTTTKRHSTPTCFVDKQAHSASLSQSTCTFYSTHTTMTVYTNCGSRHKGCEVRTLGSPVSVTLFAVESRHCLDADRSAGHTMWYGRYRASGYSDRRDM